MKLFMLASFVVVGIGITVMAELNLGGKPIAGRSVVDAEAATIHGGCTDLLASGCKKFPSSLPDNQTCPVRDGTYYYPADIFNPPSSNTYANPKMDSAQICGGELNMCAAPPTQVEYPAACVKKK